MKQNTIKNLKNDTVDLMLRAGLIIASIGVLLLSVRDYPRLLSFQSICQYIILIILILLVVFKHKVSYHLKTNCIIWGLFILMLVGLSNNGFQASAKVYIILAPVITSFLYSYKKSYLLLGLFVLVYLLIGYLKTSGLIPDTNSDITYKVWLADGAILVLGSYILLFVGNRYRTKLFDAMADIEAKNEELEKHRNHLELKVKIRTEEIEVVNEELKSSNEELYAKNEIINNKNIEINAALNHLKETQLQFLQTEKMASLGTLTAGVAHEINNPLNYIMGAYFGLSNYFNEFGSMEKERTEVLMNNIDVGIERISGIVKGLNEFSRSNDDMKEDCDIHSILNNCFAMLHNKTKHNADVVKEYAEEQIFVKGNVGKLHQVFLNILTNAIQSIIVNGNIVATTRVENNYVFIEIIDNGCGVKKEHLQQLTDPFFTTKPPGEGTGLGLSITYKIIEEHKGIISFESELQKGTKVTIRLPIK